MDDIVTLSTSAHLPVVFATQVLETLAKSGTPSRAEMSDVALAARCECVMLNKVPSQGKTDSDSKKVCAGLQSSKDRHVPGRATRGEPKAQPQAPTDASHSLHHRYERDFQKVMKMIQDLGCFGSGTCHHRHHEAHD